MAIDGHSGFGPGGETVFTVEAPRLKFGSGALGEIGEDARALGLTRVALFTDPVVAGLEPVADALAALRGAGVDTAVYDEVEVEPTDRSFRAGARFAAEGRFDGFVAVGGGSSIDTCKAANLISTYPDDLLAYVDAPVGRGKPVPGPLRPHIACPTTFGTASESTGIAVFDLLEMGAKTGIVGPRLRPDLGVLDPDALASLPAPVVAANGFDMLSHAVESFTARPYTRRPAPAVPARRPLGQGANPYADIACLEAIRLVGANLAAAVADPADRDRREALMFTGLLAGIGFGNAGCHLPHGMSYPVAGLVRGYRPEGWPADRALVPHGISVIVNAPAVFRRMGEACPERHLRAARALGVEVRGLAPERAGDTLAGRVIAMMARTGMPNGLRGVGYDETDIDALTERAWPQKRLIDNAPRAIAPAGLAALFRESLDLW